MHEVSRAGYQILVTSLRIFCCFSSGKNIMACIVQILAFYVSEEAMVLEEEDVLHVD